MSLSTSKSKTQLAYNRTFLFYHFQDLLKLLINLKIKILHPNKLSIITNPNPIKIILHPTFMIASWDKFNLNNKIISKVLSPKHKNKSLNNKDNHLNRINNQVKFKKKLKNHLLIHRNPSSKLNKKMIKPLQQNCTKELLHKLQ